MKRRRQATGEIKELTGLSVSTQQKIHIVLLEQVFKHSRFSQLNSLFCATIILISLYHNFPQKLVLIAWYSAFMLIICYRFYLTGSYLKQKNAASHLYYWQKIFMLGACLGGVGWGFAGGVLFPLATNPQQTLIVLVLAGITAGATPLLAAQLKAAVTFLLICLVPLIVALFFLRSGENLYNFFTFAAIIYLGYLIVLSIRAHYLIKYTIGLQFENDVLLKNLSLAKNQLEIINKKLAEAATHDPLTQLPNRSLFNLNLATALKRAEQTHSSMALLYLDLDHFKVVNDVYGHDIGDQLLIKVVQRLHKNIRSTDMIARLGGDEFTMIIENIPNVDFVAYMAKQLCEIVSLPIIINEHPLQVSISIGISIYPLNGLNAEDLLRKADKAMYFAKEHGRNLFHFTAEKI